MAKYNPFGERAGMKKVTEQEPSREILRVSRALAIFPSSFDKKKISAQNT